MSIRPEDKLKEDYKYGFVTDIETEEFPKGLSEDIVRLISQKKNEPEWLLDFRLKAFRHWQTMTHPTWQYCDIPEINYQDIYYYSKPKTKKEFTSEEKIKYLNNINVDYPKKNWSSVIICNCSHPKNKVLAPEFISSSDGKFLHRFMWLDEEDIGEIYEDYSNDID